LIVRAGALGDTLMLIPAISGLKKGLEIIVTGRRPGIDYIRPYVDQCIDIETSGCHRLFMEESVDPARPSLPDADHIVAFFNDPDGRLKNNLKACFPGRAVDVFPVFPPAGDNTHTALYMARSFRDASLPIDPEQAFAASFEIPLMADCKTGEGDTAGIVIHPGSGSQKKNYPPAFWLKLIKGLRGPCLDPHLKVVLLLGPAEQGLYTSFKEDQGLEDIDIRVSAEREELLSVLGNASVYIGHDSGVTHLAAMMGIHVIAIFKESSAEQWGPLGPNVRIITKDNYNRSS